MELLQINKNELKITLSSHDLEEFDLTVNTIDYNNTKTRKAIWEIFDRAKSQLGFDAAKSKLRIKVYPLSDGGCDMYVSKLSQKLYTFHAVKSVFRFSPKKRAFVFDSFDALFTYCTLVPNGTPSHLYLDNNGRYILLTEQGIKMRYISDRIKEFGNPLNITYIESYLNERCSLLCAENAVSKIIGQ